MPKDKGKGKGKGKSSDKKEADSPNVEGRLTRSSKPPEASPSPSAVLPSASKRKTSIDFSHLAPPSPRKQTKFSESDIRHQFAAIEAKKAALKKKEEFRQKQYERHERAQQRAEDKGKELATTSDYSDLTSDDDSVSDPHFESQRPPDDFDDDLEDDDEEETEALPRQASSESGSGSVSKPRRQVDESTPSRKKTSPVWDHFEVDPHDPNYVVCQVIDLVTNKKCEARIKRPDQNTSGMSKHLRQHKQALAEVNKKRAKQVVLDAQGTTDVIESEKELASAVDQAREILGKKPQSRKMPFTKTLHDYFDTNPSLTRYPMQSESQKRIDLAIMTYIARCNLPISTVDHPGFIEWVGFLFKLSFLLIGSYAF